MFFTTNTVSAARIFPATLSAFLALSSGCGNIPHHVGGITLLLAMLLSSKLVPALRHTDKTCRVAVSVLHCCYCNTFRSCLLCIHWRHHGPLAAVVVIESLVWPATEAPAIFRSFKRMLDQEQWPSQHWPPPLPSGYYQPLNGTNYNNCIPVSVIKHHHCYKIPYIDTTFEPFHVVY